MRTLLVAAASACIAQSVCAATLESDALLCDSPEPFAVIAAENWTSIGAAAELKTASMTAQYYELASKGAKIKKQLAAEEEAIRADGGTRLAQGQTGARAVTATSDEGLALANVKIYKNIVATCSSSGAVPIQVDILERKPISGLVKVRAIFKGNTADLWTRSEAVKN